MSTNLNDPTLVDVMEAVRRLSTNDQLLIASSILQAAVSSPGAEVLPSIPSVNKRSDAPSLEDDYGGEQEETERQRALTKFIEEWGPLNLDGDEIVRNRTINVRHYDF